jgi:hypothetical protein
VHLAATAARRIGTTVSGSPHQPTQPGVSAVGGREPHVGVQEEPIHVSGVWARLDTQGAGIEPELLPHHASGPRVVLGVGGLGHYQRALLDPEPPAQGGRDHHRAPLADLARLHRRALALAT